MFPKVLYYKNSFLKYTDRKEASSRMKTIRPTIRPTITIKNMAYSSMMPRIW